MHDAKLMNEGLIEARHNLSRHVGVIFARAARSENLNEGELRFLRFAEEMIDEFRLVLGDADVLRGDEISPAILEVAVSSETVNRCLAYASEAFARLGQVYPSQELLDLFRTYRGQVTDVIATGCVRDASQAGQLAAFFSTYSGVIEQHHNI